MIMRLLVAMTVPLLYAANFAGARASGEPDEPPIPGTAQTERMDIDIERNAPGATDHRRFDQHYTMLYYTELPAADRFYGDLLGLERSYEDDWVHLYRATGDSYIGVVREGPGAFHRARADSAVMVSLVTRDVDALYRRVQQHPELEIASPLQDKDSAPIRAFIVRDPGGYTVEVFQWLKSAD